MESSGPTFPGTSRRRRSGRALTIALWVTGIALQFAAPLLRDRVPLSDDLFIESFLVPVWMFLLVSLLAGWLRLFQRASDRWSGATRAAFSAVSAVVFMLAQPEVIEMLIAESVPLSDDPIRVAWLWSAPLAFYVVPAAIVCWAWASGESRLNTAQALGAGLVFIGIVNFPFILWLTHLWDVYIRDQGGDSVLRTGHRLLRS